MPSITKHPSGAFCWVELMTSDSASAREFYTSLFHWTAQDVPMAGGTIYHMLQLGGSEVGALYQRRSDQERIPPHWACYVAVENVDEASRQVSTLGGTTLQPPVDVPDAGRMTFIQDPTGAALGLWQAKTRIGARVANEPGAVCWHDLGTSNEQAAGTFYARMFGWSTKPLPMTPPYTIFSNGGTEIGGMYKLDGPMSGLPSQWIPYFQVHDCNEAVTAVNALGGKTVVPPMNIEVGRFAYLQDRQGAVFAVVSLHPR